MICVGRFEGWRADVSAVDTWLCGEWVRQVLGGASRFSHLGGNPTGPCLAPSGARAGAQRSCFDDDLSRVFFSSERPTARGWGCTGRGLCALHEPPDPVEYTRPSASGSRPSCSSGGVRSESRAEALIEPAPRPGAPCTLEPACSSTPRPGVSRFWSPASATLRSRPPGASTSA